MSFKLFLYIKEYFNAMIVVVINMNKRRKLKRNILIIFLICLLLIIGSLLLSPQKSRKKTPTAEELKLQKLDHIEKKISYFDKKHLNRYIAYQKKNPSLSPKKIVVDVEIGLDYAYYTNTKKAPNQNTEKILVNKYYYLGEDYVPNNLEEINKEYARSGMKLVKEAKDAFESLSAKAKEDDLQIIAMSSYRSYQYQDNLYNRYVQNDGVENADTYSARPGFSEHQTGLAIDIYNGKENYTNFENTEEFKWMQENAYKYGFILRFPKDKTKETGYQYESWHYRYVGVEISKIINQKKICLEEYYVENS